MLVLFVCFDGVECGDGVGSEGAGGDGVSDDVGGLGEGMLGVEDGDVPMVDVVEVEVV